MQTVSGAGGLVGVRDEEEGERVTGRVSDRENFFLLFLDEFIRGMNEFIG